MQDHDLLDFTHEDAFNKVIDEYHLMESHIIYFSAGDSKIKELMIKRDPTFSA